LWHWTQAILIILLGVTGFEIHGTIQIFGFERAVDIHNFSAWSVMGLIAFAIFWHFTTGEWKQYIPTTKKIREMAVYYTRGIFRGEPHPVAKSRQMKLNPLQRMAYFFLKIFIFPFQIITGLFLYFYNSWSSWGIAANIDAMAVLHTLGAFFFLTFFIIHVYLTTTGETPTSHIRAMITGTEEVEARS
jgi:thiosulfate reductase cytochrome b subunit